MLAKETDDPFDGKDWIFEIKWDGYRAIAEVNNSKVKLYSRNGNSFENNYPIVVDELKKLGITAVLDGEIVVMNESGIPSFQLLQHYGTNPDHPIHYYVFDILSLNGKDLKKLPLIERKNLLKKVLRKNEVIKYSDHVKEAGKAFFETAIHKSLEGIMAKKADSLYHPGVRTSEWLKIKHHHTGEAIIVGFTEPTGSRKHFGALVLALKKGKELVYAGHTGTGFTDRSLNEMYQLLKPLITNKSPFKEKVQTNMPVTWVKPQLVGELKFTEVTRDGKMRHPVFLRLRTDKPAKEATMKQAAEIIKKPVKRSSSSTQKKAKPEKTSSKKEDAGSEKNKTVKINGHELKLTNLQKVFWPKEGFTKGDVIEYYQSVSKYIMPYLKGRPQSLFRSPNGINDKGFFQKDAGDAAPDWVESIEIFSDSANKEIDYILCNNQATLTYLNNLGCIEINPWHSTVKKLDHPDYLVIDIDPSPKNNFDQVVETALVIRDVLKKAGVEGYCKTSGATGLHVYIPAQKKYTYDQLKDFAQLICMMVHEQLPKFTSMERNLKKRGNKIYLDHLQNRRGQTISSVYSLRPKEGASVSTPLEWKEVKPGLSPLDFNIKSIFKRLEKKGDLFVPVLGKGIDLRKCLQALEK